MDIRAIPTRRNAIVLLLILTAWLITPPAPSSQGSTPVQILQRVLGPLRVPIASTLRLRAGFARASDHVDESLRLQYFALDLDPDNTDAVVWLAGELATQIPASGLTSRDRADCARAGIDVLRRARDLGNGDPRLLDWEAFLWVVRFAPPGSDRAARRIALDNAIEACEAAAATWLPANARASGLLAERAALFLADGDATAAAADFIRAAQHERILAERGLEGAASRAADFEARAEDAATRPR